MSTARTYKRVRELVPGDILSPTGREVRGYPTRGLRTPPRKLEVRVSARGIDHPEGAGRDRWVEWNADTKVAVLR